MTVIERMPYRVALYFGISGPEVVPKRLRIRLEPVSPRSFAVTS